MKKMTSHGSQFCSLWSVIIILPHFSVEPRSIVISSIVLVCESLI